MSPEVPSTLAVCVIGQNWIRGPSEAQGKLGKGEQVVMIGAGAVSTAAPDGLWDLGAQKERSSHVRHAH